MDGTSWCVVYTKPNEEARAASHLSRQNFGVYLPRYAKIRRHARKTDRVVRPLFPGYLFIALDLARDRWRSVKSTLGVVNLVMSGERPVSLPCGVLDAIRAREDAQGLVSLSLPPALAVGSRIKLLDGIFADHGGVLDSISDERRVAVLVQLLGRQARVIVDADSVSAF